MASTRVPVKWFFELFLRHSLPAAIDRSVRVSSRGRAELPGGRGHAVLDVLDEGLHLRGEVAARRIDDVDRRRGQGPIGEEALEAPGGELLHAEERGKNGDAEAGGRDRAKGVHVVYHQARREGDVLGAS